MRTQGNGKREGGANGDYIEDKNEITILRIFDAPREKAWRAWTNQKEAKKWWGGLRTPLHQKSRSI